MKFVIKFPGGYSVQKDLWGYPGYAANMGSKISLFKVYDPL